MAAGVKELLVISQDTSAYGVDLRYPATTLHGENTRPVSWTWRARWARWASGCACTMSTLIRMSMTCCR